MKPKIIAFYLPQFYPFKENDEWWGKGFTEWTNVVKARALFRGHYQPRIPADLGFYDLRVLETRKQQAELAKKANVFGFCYWHYWFGKNKQLMNRVFDEVIESKSPDFPVCLGWANHSWYAKTWDRNGSDKLLIEQKYEGIDDFYAHFIYALKAFKDPRYIKIGNKPLFYIFEALSVPKEFFTLWNKWAIQNGFDGICFIGRIKNNSEYSVAIEEFGYDYVMINRLNDILLDGNIFKKRFRQLKNKLMLRPRNCFEYSDALPYFINTLDNRENVIPTLIPNWDHSPRSKDKGIIFHNSTPKLWQKHIRQVFDVISKKNIEEKIIFLKSWNEWAEGNYMEPDERWGHDYINILNDEYNKYFL